MRRVVVTGVTSGVGLEVTRRFVGRGDEVAGIARDTAKLTQLSADLGVERFLPYPLDVRRSTDVARVFRDIGARLGCIDVLVNNAAVFKMAPFESFTIEEIDDIIDTNLKGTIYCTHHALPFMKRGSRIINIASVSATHGIAEQAVYSASKYGVDGFGESLGPEVSPRGIHITTLCPGGIATPLWNENNPYPGDRARLLTAGDVADVVDYVAGLPERVVLKQATFFPSNEWH